MYSEHFHVLEDQAVVQRRLSVHAMHALQAAKAAMNSCDFDLQWAAEGGDRYLVRSRDDHIIRAAPGRDLDAIHAAHLEKRSLAQCGLAQAQTAYTSAVADNRAASAGSVPDWVIAVLQVLHEQDLMRYYRVIGTHSLHAYESAANVVFTSDTTATQDIDLLWNFARRLRFAESMRNPPRSMIDVLKLADPSFERDENNKESAINDQGYAVDFLRAENKPRLQDAYPISDHEGDVMPVQAIDADQFMQGPVFAQPVFGMVSGEMVILPTVDPVIFASFKQKMGRSDRRERHKRSRDVKQASAVVELLNAGLLRTALAADQLRGFPVDGLLLPQD